MEADCARQRGAKRLARQLTIRQAISAAGDLDLKSRRESVGHAVEDEWQRLTLRRMPQQLDGSYVRKHVRGLWITRQGVPYMSGMDSLSLARPTGLEHPTASFGGS